MGGWVSGGKEVGRKGDRSREMEGWKETGSHRGTEGGCEGDSRWGAAQEALKNGHI